MKKIIPVIAGAVLVIMVALLYLNWQRSRMNPLVVEYHQNADRLIEGLQQYKEFVKSYPSGSLADIAKALSGQSEKDRVLILATSKNQKNAKGEIVDPWGTPLQFYFAENGVMIRSAGPNRIFEDSSATGSDDLFRTEVKK
jgi:hypothetical protein